MSDDKEKPVHPRKLFYDRMRREGRYKELTARIKAIRQETTKSHHLAALQAIKEFGYESPAVERAKHAEYLRDEGLTKLQAQIRREKDEIKTERIIEDFDAAVQSLPDNAPAAVEIDWIRAHPAMARRARQKNKIEDIIVDAKDVLYAPHGRAPSKSAVYALQHWANSPHEFFKMLMSEHKKKSEEGEASKAVQPDVGLSDVRSLLEQVQVSQ